MPVLAIRSTSKLASTPIPRRDARHSCLWQASPGDNESLKGKLRQEATHSRRTPSPRTAVSTAEDSRGATCKTSFDASLGGVMAKGWKGIGMRMLGRLAAVIALGAVCAPAQEPPLKTYEDVTKVYHTEKLAEGVYDFIAPEPRTQVVSGNSVAVIGDDGVLVVDTGNVPSLARRMIGEIRKLTDKPVRFIVNTHWHPDHLM